MKSDNRFNKLYSKELGLKINTNKENSFCLITPGSYRSLLENLGIQTLYELINTDENTYAERAYIDYNNSKIRSIESQTELNKFDVLGISVTNPLQINSIFEIFEKTGINISSKKRQNQIVVGGGMGLANPLPYSDMFDIIFLGDAYSGIQQFISLKNEIKSKEELLYEVSKLDSVYVPMFHKTEKIIPITENVPSNISLASSRFIKDFASIIIDNGCTFGCDFCEYFYNKGKKYSDYSLERIIQDSQDLINNNVKKIFLYSASAGNHPELKDILNYFENKNIPLDLQPTRIEQIDDEMLHFVKKNINHLVLNPDTPTDHLRQKIKRSSASNKDYINLIQHALTSFQIFDFSMHFIINYFGESENYMQIAETIQEVLSINNNLNLNVYINPLFPSPNTPLERHPMNFPEETNAKIKKIIDFVNEPTSAISSAKRQYDFSNHSKIYKGKRLSINTTNMYDQLIEGILMRGDELSLEMLFSAHKNKIPHEYSKLVAFLDKHKYNWRKYFEEIPLMTELPWRRFSSEKFNLINDKRYAQLKRQNYA